MAAPKGVTGQAGQAGTLQPHGRPKKAVVPAIPLAYLQRKNKTPAAVAQQMVAAEEQDQGPSSTVTAQPDNMANEASTKDTRTPGKQPNGADAPAKTLAPTAPGEAETEPKPQPEAEAEAVGPPATAKESMTTITEDSASSLTTPSGTMAPDTPPSDPSTHIPEGVVSPTPTRQRMPLPSYASNGSSNDIGQTNHTLQQSNGSVHKTGRFPAHRVSSNHSRTHQARPSNGNFTSGGFLNSLTSTTSYPVPDSGGPVQQPNSNPSVVAHHALQAEGISRSAVGGLGRPLHIAPQDGFPPGIYHHQQRLPQGHLQSYGLPMQHSYQGSQSSVQADEQSYGPSPHGNSTYSVRSIQLPIQQFYSGHHDPGFNVTSSSTAISGASRADVETLFFLQNSFGDREFSDCTLELRFVQQEASQELPCHRVVISRSPKLRHLLRTTVANLLVIELDDPYMRPDAFAFTVRTLYGWDIDREPYLPGYRPPQDAKQALDLSLGYAAAARYLDLPFVHATAIRHACQHLTWDTIERASQFALPRAISLQAPWLDNAYPRPEEFSVWELLGAITTFLVYNFPTDFFLDVNANDHGFSRIPATDLVTRRHEETVGPHSHRPTKSHHLSIQFGDLKPTIADTVLSRILLNLPFVMLKQVLEHPQLAQPSGELSRKQRRSLIEAVVGEREARRVRALETPQLQVLAEKLEGASKPLVVQSVDDSYVNSMGFKEEVFDGDTPYILQSWIHSSDSVST